MFDPYQYHAPRLNDPASDIILLTPADGADIAVGVKSLRIFNPNGTVSDVVVTTLAGNDITLKVPAGALVVEPIRITRLKTTTTAGVIVHGYTDPSIAQPNKD